jgi:hypothetical protein
MATRIGRPVRREVSTRHWGELIVSLTPEGIELRQKGRRKRYVVPYGVVYQRGAEIEAVAMKRERDAKRKARKLARAGRA